MKNNKEEFAKNEIALALENLKINPDNELQRDRVAYWALKLGDIELALEYGTSTKMRKILEEWRR